MAKNGDTDMLKMMGSPANKLKKCVVKGSVAIFQESIQLGVVSQDSHPEKSVQRKGVKIGMKSHRKFSKGAWHREELISKV